MTNGKLRIGVDVDDVLYLCNQHAIDLLCRDKDYLPLNIYDINGWGSSGNNSLLDERIAYFSKEDFVANQPIIPGAKEFIKELTKRGDVIFVTAVGKNCMTARAKRLAEDFPMVPERNIMIGARKDLLSLDILLDDGAHNILGSCATYPVLFRRPWNNHLTGLLSVNSYDGFLKLVDQINIHRTPEFNVSKGGVLCLVGPSGSGKGELVKELLKNENFLRPITSTTRARRPDEGNEYHFISRNEFEMGADEGKFLEYTVYGGQYYGASFSAIDEIVKNKKVAVIPVDICGAITLKSVYPKNSAIVFTSMNRSAVIRNILLKKCPDKEKVLRILSLDAEYRNENICDFSIQMSDNVSENAKQLCKLLKIKGTASK